MNPTLPTCARCSTAFWPGDRLSSDPDTRFCENCAPQMATAALSADETFEPRAFHSKPGVPVEIIRTSPKTQPPEGAPVQIQPRELPGSPSPNQTKPTPTPAVPQSLVFNCPSCMAFLSVDRNLAIGGTTAPCPNCSSQVIPPQVAAMAARRRTQESRWRPER